jgi:hypothetical protein
MRRQERQAAGGRRGAADSRRQAESGGLRMKSGGNKAAGITGRERTGQGEALY